MEICKAVSFYHSQVKYMTLQELLANNTRSVIRDSNKICFLVYGYKHKQAIAKWQGCMSNECRRVITLYALTEIREILQIEESISISCQNMHRKGMALYISFQNHNTQEGTGKVIYKPSVLDEKQLHLKQDQ